MGMHVPVCKSLQIYIFFLRFKAIYRIPGKQIGCQLKALKIQIVEQILQCEVANIWLRFRQWMYIFTKVHKKE